ncbi:glutamate--tRNA ligase [Lewinellaceae bacterium SD302]|nr:glutamate--tRNA ligase [Lewinellaceae bacterium SD302]
MLPVRVRFAPSPTGALHIGGVRTALYNYLLAKKTGGSFVLRIEDTDQKRYVEGAESYIREALNWCGLDPMEGPEQGGEYGPYRQSERRDIYQKYTQQLLDNDKAYYAFDTPEELTEARSAAEAAGKHSFKYDAGSRMQMRNSLSLGAAKTKELIEAGTPYVVRLRIEPGHTVSFSDIVRGQVSFASEELDDKVMMKADGLPTYHLANIVDDRSMKITHVIRGEEWLSSTAHHVLLYRAFGWEDEMPAFAHLPLILKPTGKGKLSKRDGQKLGMPVFPLAWEAEDLIGFREAGFDPRAVVNFLAFLGWNPGTEQEIFSLDELVEAFTLDNIGKSGARFDYDKAKWYNQQYILADSPEELLPKVKPFFVRAGVDTTDDHLLKVIGLLRERVTVYPDFVEQSQYFFGPVTELEEKIIRKKWKPEQRAKFEQLQNQLGQVDDWTAGPLKEAIVAFMEANELGFGAVLPILRVAMSGTTKGPDAFAMMEVLGKDAVVKRLGEGYDRFDAIKAG